MLIMYGPDVASLKCRMINQKPTALPLFEPRVVHEYVLQNRGKVHLTAGFFYVYELIYQLPKKIQRLHTLYIYICMYVYIYILNREKQTQIDVLSKVFDLYDNKGFNVMALITDIKFECIRDDISIVDLQTVPEDYHAGNIEVSIKILEKDLR